jgi:hypothetical protein
MTLPNIQQGLIQPMNLVLIHSWQGLGTLALVTLGLARWKTLPAVVRDAAWSCLLTFVFYIGFGSHQGHGWGYRYFHPVLGCWILLAAAGWAPLCELIGSVKARTLAGVAIGVSLLLFLPLRASQVEGFTAPYADADEALRHVHGDVVMIPPFAVWYGQDLVRNDPLFRERPKRARLIHIRPEVQAAFESHGRVVVVTGEQLAQFGLEGWPPQPSSSETPSPQTPSPQTPSPQTPSPQTPSPQTPSPQTPSPQAPPAQAQPAEAAPAK